MIYSRISVLRADRGLSRKDLAAALDINYQTVGYLERGQYSPSLDLALRMAEYFGVPLEFLFSLRPMERLSTLAGPATGSPQEEQTRKDKR